MYRDHTERMNKAALAKSSMKTVATSFGPTVTFSTRADVHARAFALVCPEAWGRADWKEAVSAVLDAKDLEAADVTIEQVVDAVAFFTATEATVKHLTTTQGAPCMVVFADGYRKGPAW